jgi:hypothetical protein
MRDSAIASGLVFRGGYRQVLREYLFRPVISVEQPHARRGGLRIQYVKHIAAINV